MRADSDKIEWLLANYTQSSIADATGVAQSKLSRISNGNIKIARLTLEVASKLTEYAEELEKERTY